MDRKYTPHNKRTHNCELIVFRHIKSGLSPSLLWKKKTLTRRQVDYALTKLKRSGFVRKIAYGTWENVAENYSKRTHKKVKKVHRVGKLHTLEEFTKKPDSVRCHGITATIKIPRLSGWNKREDVLKKLEIKYKRIPQGQRISFMDTKVWLCKDSIVFYLPYEWFADKAVQAKRQAMYDLITIIKKLEKRLKVGDNGFKVGKGYKIKFSRQHYSLIRNALARQYDKEKNKLFVYDDNGLWLIVDNSYNLHELETVHPETAVTDNEKVQAFFNGLKTTPITPQFITETMGKIANEQLMYRNDLMEYGQKIAAHAVSIEKLGMGIDMLTGTIKNLETLLTSVANRINKEEEEPSVEHEELMKIEIIEDTGDFYGIFRNVPKIYNLKKGAKIYIEKTTGLALVKSGKAKVIL